MFIISKNKFYVFISIIVSILFFTGNSAFAITYTNVQDYGAVGNGTTDDTSSIRAALNTGNPIYFPKTDAYYKVSGALTYAGSRIVSNGATIKATNTTFTILTISGANGLYVGDLTLEYPTEQEMGTGQDPLKVIYSSDFIVERVIGKKGGTIYIAESDNGIVRDCQMLDSSYNAFYVRSCSGIVVKNCYAEKSISAFAMENSKYVEFINNTAYDCNLGLRIEDSAHALAEGNFFRYCISGAVAYGPQSGSTLYTTDIIFRGNTFYHCYKNITVNKDEPYVNKVCEFILSSKMRVGDVTFDNNIVIGNDESTLLTDLSSNVVFNTNIGLTTAQVSEDASGTSYYTAVPYVKYVHINKTGGVPEDVWLFYVNFPSGIDISEEDVMTMDFCWLSGSGMDEETMAVSLYSGENRSGFICQIPLYNPYDYIAMPTILRIPDNVDVSNVKSIEVIRIGGPVGAGFTVSEIRKGLKSKVGYYHSYYHTETADGVQNAVLDSNVFVDVDYPYLDRKRTVAPEMTVITGSGMTGTTAQRPSSPEVGWHYYDTDLNTAVYWNGDNWFDISAYLMGSKVNKAIHFDGDNFVNLGNNEDTDLDHYTIEAWVKPTDSNVADRRIMERYDSGDPDGWLLMLWSDNTLCGYQSVNGNFYSVMTQEPFPHDNEFHHVAMTFNYNGTTSTLKLYIDGELVDTGSTTGIPDYPLASLDIKCGNGFEGSIDAVKFHTRTLSGSEIQASYIRGTEQQYAHWRFNDGSGAQANDYSPCGSESTASNNAGTLTNMNTATCWVDGKAGKALSFDGTDDYVNFGNSSWLNSTNYTISAWIKPTDSNVADRRIVERYDSGDPNGLLLMLWSDNTLCGYQSVNNYFYEVMVQVPFPHDNEFHHVAMTFNYNSTTSTLKLYIDGELVDTGSTTGTPDYADEDLDLKCGYNFEGIIDEVKYYKRTLKAEEIEKEFYRDGELFTSPSLLTVGTGGDYSTLTAALDDVTTYDTIQFIDNQTHTITSQLALTDDKYEGLKITSLKNQRATLNFTGSSYWGLLFGANDMMLENLNLVNNGPAALFAANSTGTNATVAGVNFVSEEDSTNLMETGNGMNISYCTFLGTGANSTGGTGISWTANTIITVDHCSFDQLRRPIYNPSNSTTTELTLTNSAFGAWEDSKWTGGVTIEGTTAVVTENDNASYGPRPFIRTDQLSKVTSGGDSFEVDYYTDIFAEDTSAGEWDVDPDLYDAASDGTAIGAWQEDE